jgi:UDPglucose 6-dehydrogenase
LNADLVILLTEWEEFKIIDFKKIIKKKTFNIYDLRNLYNIDEMKRNKIKYFSIGRPNTK